MKPVCYYVKDSRSFSHSHGRLILNVDSFFSEFEVSCGYIRRRNEQVYNAIHRHTSVTFYMEGAKEDGIQ